LTNGAARVPKRPLRFDLKSREIPVKPSDCWQQKRLMKINDPDTARRLVGQWRLEPIAAQLRNLRSARENLELDQMYYEQKGNDRGVERCRECLAIIATRESELKGLSGDGQG
jgi:hypothetical protein